ncbi:nitrogenase molybdenum-iron protein subunit beta [Raineyella sp. LH-20]|uniref:nitrogenase molybdenum-iron protein subunit beta n=1 Tax=Raineyella sp. LH-20 TaxID=3081204 RepID=UPI002952F9E7|nr:nitrogenase molybdenum-iron protein subunit beta [Raineyella sp. LH-20]WOP17330.1 nitrogenase molybdenum-iron protein subunit beta [Raineyella sp. LH-20]
MLEHTPTPVVERSALRINPAKTCQPIGAMYAAMGIHRCLPYSHGSQGCCSYHRSHLTRHFKEPVMAATSSFTEGASVFGGQPNLLQGLGTVFSAYDPDVVAITTTCLSETIGDDIPQIVGEAERQHLIPDGKYVIHANTPSYVGSHVTGFANMCTAMARYFATPITTKPRSTDRSRVNIVPGFVNPSDMREIRRLAEATGLAVTMFPDTSGVLDAPQTGHHEFYPAGGTTVEELRNLGRAKATLALGPWASRDAAVEVEQRADVPRELLDLPIGIAATDRFLQVLASRGGTIGSELEAERGRLVDLVVDAQQHFYGRKVAIFGDPDHVLSLTEFCRDLGMIPVHVLTGTPGKKFVKRAGEILGPAASAANIAADADLFTLHQWIKNEPVDLLLGTTYGKYIARAEDIPLVRVGWPVLDRYGQGLLPTLGYAGGVQLATRMLDALLDRRDRDAVEHEFELVL